MQVLRAGRSVLTIATILTAVAGLNVPGAHADNDDNTLALNNKRLNDGVAANVFTIQHHAGCINDVRINPQLQLAAQRHAQDVLNDHSLDADIGSDGSTAQSRATTAGFRGTAAETVAINPALAISGIELINQWYHNPAYYTIMSDCANTQIGVWSVNSVDRTVVVAVYGRPDVQPADINTVTRGFDPNPDYDASDELEYGLNWLPWILRGVYPPPAYPPN